jgi:OmpA-OmpF porin, OOP family
MKPFLRSCLAGLIVASLGASFAALAQRSPTGAYGVDSAGRVVKGTFGECWRTSQWSPGTLEECDSDAAPRRAVLAPPPPAPAPEPVAQPVVPAAAPLVVAPRATPLPPRTQNFTLGADASFDTGKAELKPQGKVRLDQLAAKLKDARVDSIAVTGHTDNVGSDAVNQRLSLRRAEAVKAYLMQRGIEPGKIRTAGRGKSTPLADNRSSAGRAKNRRVEVDIKGERTL